MYQANVSHTMALLGLALLCRPSVLSDSAHVVAPRHALPAHATITGTVFDSLANQPLANALVQFVATENLAQVRSVRAGLDGRFAFDSVSPGRYLIEFLHPKLDSLLLQPPRTAVEVTRDQLVTTVPLSIPSALSIRALFCGQAAPTSGALVGLMLGRVRTPDGSPVDPEHGGVRAQWRQLHVDDTGVRPRLDSATYALRASADFVLCGLPHEGPFTTQAWLGVDSSGVSELEVPEDGILRRDLFVSAAARRGQLVGFVRDSAGGGLVQAQVANAEKDIATVTDSSGQFVLRRLKLGTQSIDVRALGYLPRRVVVDVVDAGSNPARIVLQRPPTTLRAMTVRAMRSYAGFEVRRTSGVGLFLDEAAITQRNPFIFADIMRSLPGVSVSPVKSFSAKFYTRFGIRSCEPSVWVDGVEIKSRTQDLDAHVDVTALRAVEVYASPAEVPAGFAGDPLCGAVLIWTRRPDVL